MNIASMLDLAADTAFDTISRSKQAYFLGAVGIRRDGAIVAATNQAQTQAMISGAPADRNWSAHAERRLCRKLDAGSFIFVARVNRKGEWRMSRPCDRCQRSLQHRRVRMAYYTIAPGEYGVIKFS